jgi:hypothetical protein
MINDEEDINNYIKICSEKKIFHLKNSQSAAKWNSMFNLVNVILTATTALSMTILTVLDSSDINISIIGGTFAFLIAISNQIQKNYNFSILNYQHSDLSQDFFDLENQFIVTSKKIHNYDDYEKLILRYLNINSRTNILTVRPCYDIFCLCS